MDYAESVGDECVGQFSHFLGEGFTLRVILRGFAGVESNILQQDDLAVLDLFCRLVCRGARCVLCEADGGIDQLCQTCGNGLE